MPPTYPLPPADAITVIEGADAPTYDSLAARDRPLVMRGLVRDWPIVRAAAMGVREVARYLAAFDNGRPMHVFTAPPAQGGRYFYADDLRGLNFGTEKVAMTRLVDALLDLAEQDEAPSLYAGSALAAENLTRFAEANPMPLPLPGAEPRLWIGNRSRIATHFDMSDNVACVAAGHRRFVLFPPEQVANLYIGPIERTPAGQPVSMVDPLDPDLDRYPRFAAAQAAMAVVDLAPGDALFIPSLWWHAVIATDSFNILVNYWAAPHGEASPLAAMVHTLHAVRDLPPRERAAWRTWFDHYVFGDDAADAAGHLPDHARGVLSPTSSRRAIGVRAFLRERSGMF